MSDQLRTLLTIIPSLNSKELDMLRARIDGAQVVLGKTPPKSEVNLTVDWITPGIHSELVRRGLTVAPLTALYRIAPGGYKGRIEEVQALLASRVAPTRLTRPERLALGREAGLVLAEYIEGVCKMTVGVKLMLSFAHRIPDAFENAFPGYLQAGLLRFLIKTGKHHDR